MNEQQDAPPEAAVATPEAVTVPPPTPQEMAGWKGHRLDEIGGHGVGKIEGVYVDERSGDPEWLLARMGRFGHYCLVPARDAVLGVERVWVPYSRDVIRKAPRIEPRRPLERERELELLEHYGIGTREAGRGQEIAAREGDAVTARPYEGLD